MLLISYAILTLCYVISINGKWVVDVDSSIVNDIKNNPSVGYLIKFHAPWFEIFPFLINMKKSLYLGADIVDILNQFMKKLLKK